MTTEKNNIGFLWFLVAVILIVAFWFAFTQKDTSQSDTTFEKKQENEFWENVPIQGANHIAYGAKHPPYNTNPPTSGWHYGNSADWGVYQKELEDELVVHSLEHGGIWISYKDIDKSTKEKLEKLAKKYPQRVVLSPRQKNDSKIAVVSWGKIMKLDEFDENKIETFILKNTNKSPEKFAR